MAVVLLTSTAFADRGGRYRGDHRDYGRSYHRDYNRDHHYGYGNYGYGGYNYGHRGGWGDYRTNWSRSNWSFGIGFGYTDRGNYTSIALGYDYGYSPSYRASYYYDSGGYNTGYRGRLYGYQSPRYYIPRETYGGPVYQNNYCYGNPYASPYVPYAPHGSYMYGSVYIRD
ncbi:MAG TPA: hypothetical protein PK402_07355 [Tepidisphaeraceae bacterium]|nr:hypothetical protein [Tepidisphaeraceae bacterium]